MSTSIQTRHEGDTSIIELRGRITIDRGATLLREAVEAALNQGFRRIILDLKGVVAIDSSGLQELVRSTTIARQTGTKIVLAGITDKIQDILQITSLISIFEQFDSTENALLGTANL